MHTTYYILRVNSSNLLVISIKPKTKEYFALTMLLFYVQQKIIITKATYILKMYYCT
jgi:hypothetical protein